MARLVWDKTGEHYFETGTKQGVCYPQANDGTYPKGEAWNGLRSVSMNPTGAEATELFADDIKYLNIISTENLEGSIGAYTYPDGFAECNGEKELVPGVVIGQQARKPFGFCFRSVFGNDTQGNDHGYKLHLIYGATVSPSEKGYETVNDSPDAIEFSWDYKTTPVAVEGFKPTASLEIDSTKVDATKLADLEAVLYGDDGTATYTEFSGSEFAANTDYYTRSGTEGHYVYTKTSDSTPAQGTTYYTKSVNGATTARLPLPDEVASILGGSTQTNP